jgi:hypothetical protein
MLMDDNPETSTIVRTLRERSWFARNLGAVLRMWRRDAARILAGALLLGLFGAGAGWYSGSVTSTAYLLLSPLPLRESTTEDSLTRMIAEPLDAITASLLCQSDEVFHSTMRRYNARVARIEAGERVPLYPGETGGESDVYDGDELEELRDLRSVRRALSLVVTISKETPYELLNSPIIKLTAKCRTPQMAKLLVDIWSEACVEAAERLQAARHAPSRDAFRARHAEVREDLAEIDESLRNFYTENNVELATQQLSMIVGLITAYEDELYKTQQEVMHEQARLEAMQAALADQEPTRTLAWTPSGRLLDLLGGQLGAAPEAGGATPGVLVMEEQNPVYNQVLTEAAIVRATVSGQEARAAKIEELLESFNAQREAMQARQARLQVEETRLKRELETMEETYKNVSQKLEYARLASELGQPELQVLSLGGEWPISRLAKTLALGMAGFLGGLALGAVLSLFGRMFLLPAMRELA